MKLDQPWLSAAPVQQVLDAIEGAGGQARFVGGCVRDAILGRKLGDFDIATTLRPEAVMAACEQAGCKVVPTGIKHGTVTVIASHQPFEVTTLRRDVSTDGRWAEVEYTDDWQQDAARRDFTMNALFCDRQGHVTDFFSGLEDLKAGLVRFVGMPEQRIKEDVLRILRFFRFHAHYGRAAPDAGGLAACKALAHLLPALSAERVRTELLKTLQAENPVPVWRLMNDVGVFTALGLPFSNLSRLEQVAGYENALARPDAIRRLWAVTAGEMPDIGSRLRLSNDEAQRLKALVPLPVLPSGDEARLRMAYRLSVQTIVDVLVVSGQATRSNLDLFENWQRPQFPLKGADLAALGVAQGPQMGVILGKVEQWWVEQNFAPDHAACMAQARSLLG